MARPLRPAGRLLNTITRPFGLAEHPLQRPAMRARTGDVFFFGAVSAAVVYGAWRALDYVQVHVGLGAFGHVFVLGAATFARVVVLLIVASIIWVPTGIRRRTVVPAQGLNAPVRHQCATLIWRSACECAPPL